ncbi:uncharacterized protein HLK63_H03795 [Nakaseomyces glabratus]|nr:uncharacterized protein GW608_H03795 [Nakaseomyces glabratus]UCS26169.1 uncharacterized protein HLK63_H03795 [Nakaseomyces glabratus]UCS31399.1 uncharacterized protein HLK64_H03795 [Nakaseomyces glabratus]UCS36628.1 uncharacterized protein HLK62_H03795 [Nakaseomyces glabratus]
MTRKKTCSVQFNPRNTIVTYSDDDTIETLPLKLDGQRQTVNNIATSGGLRLKSILRNFPESSVSKTGMQDCGIFDTTEKAQAETRRVETTQMEYYQTETDRNEELEALRLLISRCFTLCNMDLEVPTDLDYDSVCKMFSLLSRAIPQNFKERTQEVKRRLDEQQIASNREHIRLLSMLKEENGRLRKLLGYFAHQEEKRRGIKPIQESIRMLIEDSVSKQEMELELSLLKEQYEEQKVKYLKLKESSLIPSINVAKEIDHTERNYVNIKRERELNEIVERQQNNIQELESKCCILINERSSVQNQVNKLRRELREAKLLLSVQKDKR